MILSIDPGMKTFALAYIKDNKPIYFCYNPYISKLQINIDSINSFYKIAKLYIKPVDKVIIERYVARRITRGISPEKMNMSIFCFVFACLQMNKQISPLTNSWKRMLKVNGKSVKYDLVIEYFKKLGYLLKDKHFADCMLMHHVIEKNNLSILQSGLPIYKKLKERKVI